MHQTCSKVIDAGMEKRRLVWLITTTASGSEPDPATNPEKSESMKVILNPAHTIRLVPRVEDADFHLCHKCRESAERYDLLDIVAALADRGSWLCPYSAQECGRSIAA